MTETTTQGRPRINSDTSSITEEDGHIRDKINDLRMAAMFVPGQVIITPNLNTQSEDTKRGCMQWQITVVAVILLLLFLWTSPLTLVALILSIKATAEMKKGSTKKAEKFVKVAKIILIVSASVAIVTLALTLVIYLGVVPAILSRST